MLEVITLIKDIVNNPLLNPTFLPISHPKSVDIAKETLIENENDYLEGAIILKYNSEVILTKDMETTDLLCTWQTLVEPLLTPGEQEYDIEILDSLYNIKLMTNSLGYTFVVESGLHKTRQLSHTIPQKEYENKITKGFLEFAKLIVDNQLSFD